MNTMKYLMTIAALMTAMACNGRKAATETLAASGEQTVQQIDPKKKAYPEADVDDGFSIYGHEVRTGKKRVEKWLKKLGYQEMQ